MFESGIGLEENFQRKNNPVETTFEDLWPSETRGNGVVVKNNTRDGSAQGKGSFIRKAHCRMCGFPTDLTTNDHSGGSIDGNGAGGGIAVATATVTLPNGTIHTENYGTQTYNKAAGCPLCFSKNSSGQRIILTGGNPWDHIQPFGF